MTLSGFISRNPAASLKAPTSSRKSKRRTRAPSGTQTQRNDDEVLEVPKDKGKRKENINVSPTASPQTTPKKRRLQRALGSETNLKTPDDSSGSLTPVQGESSKVVPEAAGFKPVIDLTRSPSAPRIGGIGLPTPVTGPKRRTGSAVEHTPTPTRKSVLEAQTILRTRLRAPGTPRTLRPTKEILQQPTPASPLRIRTRGEMSSPVWSPSYRYKPAPPSPLASPIPGDPEWEEYQQEKEKAKNKKRQFYQIPNENPFLGDDVSGTQSSLFESSADLSRRQTPPSPSRRMSVSRSSSSSRIKPPSSANTSYFRTPTPPHPPLAVVPTSQPDEEELVYFSPLRPPRTPTRQYIALSPVWH